MSAISLDRVSIVFNGRPVLSDVSLEIGQGQFVALLGPNGAGKTTLMKALLGLVRPRHGQIAVLGAPAARGNTAIGYVPQFRSMNGTLRLCGRDFVASTHHGQRWGRPWLSRDARREVDRALATVGAEALARRPLMETSGGERQRLLLAQALLGQPRMLLLDEPLVSLDPHHQRGVVELVRQVQQASGITVLFSAHELNPLLDTIDQVLYLAHGKAVLGPVDDVITGPVLSRLYGSAIEVVRRKNRVFVIASDTNDDKREPDLDA